MPTAYNILNCIGWYRANTGVFSDNGVTPAAPGDAVYQWNDQSGSGNHLTQTTLANSPAFNNYAAKLTSAGAAIIAPYGTPIWADQPSAPASLLFDGSTSFLNMPASLAIANTGCTVILCTRGASYAPISFGTDGTNTINYGWAAGTPQQMAIYNTGRQLFPAVTYLPALSPIVHGFRCSAALNESRLYIGASQRSAIAQNFCNLNLTAGAIGRTLNVNDGTYGNYSFTGEIHEIAIFSQPLSDFDVHTLIQRMQSANQLRNDANANQIIFIGDSLTSGGPGIPTLSRCYPAVLHRQMGASFKPLIIASPGQTIALQQAAVTDQVLPLDLSPFDATITIVCCGSEDIPAGRSASQVITDLIAMCQSLRTTGMQVIVATLTPRSTASGYTSSNIATLTAVNSSIRANFQTYADGLADFAIDPRLSDCTDPTYYTDQHHTTEAGDGAKADITRAALDLILIPETTATPQAIFSYAKFYTPGRNYTGAFGNFART